MKLSLGILLFASTIFCLASELSNLTIGGIFISKKYSTENEYVLSRQFSNNMEIPIYKANYSQNGYLNNLQVCSSIRNKCEKYEKFSGAVLKSEKNWGESKLKGEERLSFRSRSSIGYPILLFNKFDASKNIVGFVFRDKVLVNSPESCKENWSMVFQNKYWHLKLKYSEKKNNLCKIDLSKKCKLYAWYNCRNPISYLTTFRKGWLSVDGECFDNPNGKSIGRCPEPHIKITDSKMIGDRLWVQLSSYAKNKHTGELDPEKDRWVGWSPMYKEDNSLRVRRSSMKD